MNTPLFFQGCMLVFIGAGLGVGALCYYPSSVAAVIVWAILWLSALFAWLYAIRCFIWAKPVHRKERKIRSAL